MRWVGLGLLGALGCTPLAPPATLEAPPTQQRVTRWLMVTRGDEPAQCHEPIHRQVGPFREDPLGVPLEIIHLNEMQSVGLRSLSYAVDGHCVFSWSFDRYRGPDEPDQLNVAKLEVSPGEHEVAVVVEYAPLPQAADPPYILGLRGSYAVTLGGASRLYITGYEKGDLRASIEERPAIRFELEAMRPRPVVLHPSSDPPGP